MFTQYKAQVPLKLEGYCVERKLEDHKGWTSEM